MTRRVNRIPDEVALKAATEFLTTPITIKELKKKYNFRGTGLLYRWIRKFGLSQPNEAELKVLDVMAKEQLKTNQEQKLEKKIQELEKELEYQKLRARAYEKMVEIAEREFSITIRKKFGSKQ